MCILEAHFQIKPKTVAAFYGRGVAYARKGLNVSRKRFWHIIWMSDTWTFWSLLYERHTAKTSSLDFMFHRDCRCRLIIWLWNIPNNQSDQIDLNRCFVKSELKWIYTQIPSFGALLLFLFPKWSKSHSKQWHMEVYFFLVEPKLVMC